MEVKMTDRDKKLLFLMIVVLIVIGFGYFVIFPSLSKITEKSTELSKLQKDWDARETKIISLAAKNKAYDELKAEYDENSAFFYPNMSSRDIEKMLTSFELSNGVTVRDMNIVMPTPITIIETDDSDITPTIKMPAAFTKIVKFFGIDALSGASDEENSDAEQEDVPDELYGVYSADISMSLGGSKENIIKSIDGLYKSFDSIRVVNYTWNENTRENSTESDRYTLSVSLQLFMADSSDERIAKEEASESVQSTDEQAANE